MLINNPKDLETYLHNCLDSIIKRALFNTGLKIEEILKQHIQNDFYNLYDPKFYTRTYNLLNSVYTLKPTQKGTRFTVNIILKSERLVHVDNSLRELILEYSSQGIHGFPVQNIKTDKKYIEEALNDIVINNIHKKEFKFQMKKLLQGSGVKIS